ncbi:hypothetical protein DJ93_322 [Bacillus clarus]|uniref:Uncharacterized protein n=1 Tax=Bacillus clarus TaxID=2338372 RepID=A0A090YUI5_9BACI|nr:hypothetical protein DJ93_322 [Bacillus clarus]
MAIHITMNKEFEDANLNLCNSIHIDALLVYPLLHYYDFI